MRLTQLKIINFFQIAFNFIWMAFMITLAFIVLCVTFTQKTALMMAHHIWAPGALWLSRTKLDIKGLHHIDLKKPHIFVMNHQSALDIPIIFTAIPAPLRFIVKKELKYIPFLGWYIWAMGMIFIDRSNRKNAIKSLKTASQKIQSGANIIAFPEGTRTNDGFIQPFKKGVFVLAIESGIPIVPIAIEGSRIAMPKKTWLLRPYTVKLNIGKPILTKHLSHDDRDTLLNSVHHQIVGLHKVIDGKGQKILPHQTHQKQIQVA